MFKISRAFGLQLHRQKHLKLSSDPFFVEKVREIVGLYLNPPHKALVLGVDKKSQTQSLDRTQPVLPEGLGYVEGVTTGYVRNGPTPLFLALNIANMMVEPRVALLVDNRGNVPADTLEAVAVTVLGEATEAAPGEREHLLSLLVERHPHLKAFATAATSALMAVRVSTYIVVQRFEEVRELGMT